MRTLPPFGAFSWQMTASLVLAQSWTMWACAAMNAGVVGRRPRRSRGRAVGFPAQGGRQQGHVRHSAGIGQDDDPRAGGR
jgi:hypothetical protein